MKTENNINNVFILTRHVYESKQDGVCFIYWGKSEHKVCKLKFTQQKPVFFIKKTQPLNDELTRLLYKRTALNLATMDYVVEKEQLNASKVDGLYFSSIKDMYDFKLLAHQQQIPLYESDVTSYERFLMERFIYASCQVEGVAIEQKGYMEIINPKISPCHYSPNLQYVSLDIETNHNATQLYSIAIDCGHEKNDRETSNNYVWLVGDLKNSTDKSLDEYTLHIVATERDLLSNFFAKLNEIDPDIIIGWNIVGFDLTVLQKKAKEYQIPFDLGRGYRSSQLKDAQQDYDLPRVFVDGRVVIDGIEALRAAFYQFNSFALDAVAAELLGETKKIDKNVSKVSEIERMFNTEKSKLAYYNYYDAYLVSQIFKKTQMFSFMEDKSRMTGLAYGRVGGSVAAFDFLYLPKLHRKKFVSADIGANVFQQSSPGGYVLNSEPGIYKNVVLLDFKSLYPSIIKTFFIDPLALFLGGQKQQMSNEQKLGVATLSDQILQSCYDADLIEGFDQAMFDKNQAILPNIIDNLWRLRDAAKKQKNSPLSQAIKIVMNSFYGVLGTSKCRFYHPQLASSITKRGHQIILESKSFIESKNWQVIYGDTDSLFVYFGEQLSLEQTHQYANTLTTQLNEWWQSTLQKTYQIPCYLELEYETLFQRFYMPTVRGSLSGSKKRYAGWMVPFAKNKLSIDDSFLMIKGLEAVRGDWVELAKVMQVQLLKAIFTEAPFKLEIQENIKKFKTGYFDEQLVLRKKIRKPIDQYVKNIPPHVQAIKKSSLIKDKQNYRGIVNYVMTNLGAMMYEEFVQNDDISLDYDYYLDHQIIPALEGILQTMGLNVESIIGEQQSLF